VKQIMTHCQVVLAITLPGPADRVNVPRKHAFLVHVRLHVSRYIALKERVVLITSDLAVVRETYVWSWRCFFYKLEDEMKNRN
jgi:hypothetical protein